MHVDVVGADAETGQTGVAGIAPCLSGVAYYLKLENGGP